MTYLLISLMCAFGAAKATIQSAYAKSRAPSFCGSIFYNLIMFSAISVLFIPIAVINGFSSTTLIFGIISGILSVAFQFFYILAFSLGKPSLVTTITNFNMFIPIFVSAIFLHEPFDEIKLIAIAVASVSIVLVTYKKKAQSGDAPTSNKWLIFTFLSLISTGLASATQKVYAYEAEGKVETFSFVAITYVTASLISLVMYLIVAAKHGAYNDKKAASLSAAGTGLALGIFQCINTYAASVISGVVLYSLYNCSVSVLFVLVRVIFFKERLTIKQIIGIALSLVAVLLMQGEDVLTLFSSLCG